MNKRLRELHAARAKLPLVELEEPYHHGYIRYFVLRDDIAKRNDVNLFRQILDKVNTQIWCDRKDFLHKGFRKGKKYKPVPHRIRYLPDQEYNELSTKAKQYFERRIVPQNMRYLQSLTQSNPKTYKYLAKPRFGWYFLKPTYFVYKQEKYIITHRRAISPEIESEINQLGGTINHDNLWPYISKVLSGSNWNKERWWNPKKEKYSDDDFKKQMLQMYL